MKKMMAGVLITMVLVGCATTPHSTPARSSNAEISISADCAIALNGQTVKLTDVGSSLTAAGRTKDAPVVIRADRSVPYQTVVDVLTQLKAAGFSNVSMATD